MLEFPGLIEQDSAGLFPADVKQRASALLKGLEGGGLGAYSHSQGEAGHTAPPPPTDPL